MSKPLACLRGRLIARERTVGCSLGHYKPSSGSIDVCGLAVIKDTGVSGYKPVLNCLAPLVGWLMFVPEGRMGVKIARS